MSSPIPPALNEDDPPAPSILNWTLGFLLVGIAWGLTTPFIRRAAVNFNPPPHAFLDSIDPNKSRYQRIKYKIAKAMWTVVDLLRSPAYAVPLVINLTGSVWFFLLIGQAGAFTAFSIVVCPKFSRKDCRMPGMMGGGSDCLNPEKTKGLSKWLYRDEGKRSSTRC